MKKATVAAMALVAMAALLPASASASSEIKRLAKAECQEERLTESVEFEARYGGTGEAAMERCVRSQRREARADCRQERRFEPAEFAAEYGGTSKAALKRCVRDELT